MLRRKENFEGGPVAHRDCGKSTQDRRLRQRASEGYLRCVSGVSPASIRRVSGETRNRGAVCPVD